MSSQHNGNGQTMQPTWAEWIQRLRDTIDKNRDKIFSAASAGVDQEQYIGLFFQAIAKNPQLAQCTLASLTMALTDSATLGLPINSIEGDGYLVPRSRSVKQGDQWTKIWEAQFQPGYLGKLKLAYESPLVAGLTVDVAREGDVYKVRLGSEQTIEHEPRGGAEITHVYAVLWLTSGCRRCVSWTVADIREHAAQYIDEKSLKNAKSAWQTSWKAMACKTVLRELLKYAPTSDRARRVMQPEEYADAELPTARTGLRSGDTQPGGDLDRLASDDPLEGSDGPQERDDGDLLAGVESGEPSEEEQRRAGLIT